jgi:hypothetical protein
MTAIIALITVLGLTLVMVAVWLFRTTRPDPELLAPLEAMSERKWRRGDPVWQRRRLDELRPEGSQPLAPSVAPPDIDEAFDLGPAGTGFDDLHDNRDRDDRDDHAGRTDAAVAAGDPSSTAERGMRSNYEVDPGLAPTPTGLNRPRLDDLPDREMDPSLVAAAMAELEAELGRATFPGINPVDAD